MADVKWIKITTDIFDDEKILLIESMPDADAIITIWFKLLCLAGKQNNGGVFLMNNRIAYTDEMLATIFRRKPATVKLALEVFERFGMIETIDGVITIPKWDIHQSLDAYEKRKQADRLYQAEKRARQRSLVGSVDRQSTDASTDVGVVDKNREDKNRLDKERGRFMRPTLDEIRSYCAENGLAVNAERFMDYYDANGWKVGRNPMKDWKATCRNWAKRDKERETEKKAAVKSAVHNFDERQTDYDALIGGFNV